MVRYLIALIVMTIVIQNTCPYGYAAKTAIAAPIEHHCPLKDSAPSEDGGTNRMTQDLRDLSQPYVIAAAPSCDTGLAFDTVMETDIIRHAGFEDFVADPPLRPPKS
jgi:hypothetical protein